ncbi:hypothetical protein Nepgr_032249 [Nepenthes gracilis]|uniref:Uncharacterized protein n=1 Tax=Nepenthes gracilis TaxID=150966 RepID=A0AAD3Y851_NEPGR|nr:hypothetical protein Nepgr_032249 [Nepenthes gracilis]
MGNGALNLEHPAPRACSKPAVPESGFDSASGSGGSVKPREPSIERSSPVVPGAELHPHQLSDHLESNVPPVSYAGSLNCGLGIPPPAADVFPNDDSVE